MWPGVWKRPWPGPHGHSSWRHGRSLRPEEQSPQRGPPLTSSSLPASQVARGQPGAPGERAGVLGRRVRRAAQGPSQRRPRGLLRLHRPPGTPDTSAWAPGRGQDRGRHTPAGRTFKAPSANSQPVRKVRLLQELSRGDLAGPQTSPPFQSLSTSVIREVGP